MMNKGMKWKKKRRYKGPLSERAVLRVEFVMFMLFVFSRKLDCSNAC